MNQLLSYIFSIVVLCYCSIQCLTLKNVEDRLNLVNNAGGAPFLNDILKYKDEIESQLNAFKKNEKMPQEIDFDLKELNNMMSLVRNTQEEQKQNFLNFSKVLYQTKMSLYTMLGEYENRISQLEYNIMDIKKYDPFIEKYTYPISKYWLKIDFHNLKSVWKYKKNKNYFSIIQENDINNLRTPATILLLKHHKIIDGFFNVDILQTRGSTADVQTVASGMVFHFVNQYKYRFIELSNFNAQTVITVGEIDNGVYKKVLSKSVEANEHEFNSLTCKFSENKIHIYLNNKKIIEIKGVDSNTNNSVGLFTKHGISEFTNIMSGDLNFIKTLNKKLVDSNTSNVYKTEFLQSYRFSKKIVKDDLSIYEIPYVTDKDYDEPMMMSPAEDLYPVPESNSYYNKLNKNEHGFNFNDDKNKLEIAQNTCKPYTSKTFNLDEWVNDNNGYIGNSDNMTNDNGRMYNWKVLNEFGISRIIYSNDYKNMRTQSSLVYKLSSCNSYKLSSYMKLENNSEAGLLFRYNNADDMYILTISVDTKNIVLKKYKNNVKTIIKSKYVPSINTFQRHHIVVDDQGETGVINISLDGESVFLINGEDYYKSAFVGFFVEYGYAIYDTLKIEPTTVTDKNAA